MFGFSQPYPVASGSGFAAFLCNSRFSGGLVVWQEKGDHPKIHNLYDLHLSFIRNHDVQFQNRSQLGLGFVQIRTFHKSLCLRSFCLL